MKMRVVKAALCAVLALGAIGSALAASSDPVEAYLASKHSVRDQILGQESLTAVMQAPDTYRGRSLEVSGNVMGMVTTGDTHLVLLDVSGTSLSVPIAEKYSQLDWTQPGRTVRCLLSVEGAVPAPFRMVSLAPETDVAVAEQPTPQGWTRVGSTSRSMAYVRTPGYQTETTEGGNTTASAGHPICTLSPEATRVYGAYYNAIRSLNPRLTEREADTITTSVLYFSDQNQVDPRLVIAMIIAESGFDVNSTSRTGAQGLGQLMPETARGLGVTDAYDPVQNIGGSVRLLRSHLDRYGGAPANAGVIPFDQIKLVMAAYNAGPGAVSRYHGVPPYRETQRYVAKVAALYRALCGK